MPSKPIKRVGLMFFQDWLKDFTEKSAAYKAEVRNVVGIGAGVVDNEHKVVK